MNVGAAGRPGRLATSTHHRAPLAFATAAVLLAGCAASAHATSPPTASPPLSAPATPSPDSSTATSPRAAVIAAYMGYKRALTAADDSQNRVRALAILAPYLPSRKTVDNAISTFAKLWQKHEVVSGVAVVHVLGVKVTGATAVLHTCEDTTQNGLKDTRTDQTVPGSQGKPDDNLITRLTYNGGWRVVVQTQLALPCRAKL